jgi:hypothetical protein
MTIPAEIQNLLTQLLVAVVGLAVAILGYYARMYIAKATELIRSKIGDQQYAWAKAFVDTAVAAAAQNPIMKDWSGAQLKEFVAKQTLLFAEKNKLPFDAGDVDLMIEAAVKWMKYEFPELPEPE